jgi:hypothetical protein
MLDLFNGRLTLDDILLRDIWFIDDLFLAQTEYLQEKRKAEEEIHRKAKTEVKAKQQTRKQK